MMECLLFIDGTYHNPSDGSWFNVTNPATGEQIGRTAMATARDVDLAVAAARRSLDGWSAVGADARAQIIHKAADLMLERCDDIARVLTKEQGKPVPDSRKEILFGIEVLRYYAEEGRRVGGSLRPSANPDVKNVVSYYPVGVAGAIVPWNYPVDLYCWKIGPALAAGCPIIVKPPHETPFAINMVVQCLVDAGLPQGVLANLPGLGTEAGVAMSDHPGISLISATASVAAGQDIMRRSAGSLKRLSLELGGHAPFIVLPDADIAEAARAAMRRSYSNMGQICITVNRILVHQDVQREFVDALMQLAEQIELGDGLQDGVAYGPVLNQAVIERVQAHVDDAVSKGGKLLTGGKRDSAKGLDRGHFYRPTLINDAPLDSLPMMEESYGPLAAIHRCADLHEIERAANSLPYGLAAYVYTADLEAGWALADRLEFGAIGVNVNDTSELQAPFGGWKLSGIGRELGPEGLAAYLEPKHIKLRVRSLSGPGQPRYPGSAGL